MDFTSRSKLVSQATQALGARLVRREWTPAALAYVLELALLPKWRLLIRQISFWCPRDVPSFVDRRWATCKHSFRKHTRWHDPAYDGLRLQTATSGQVAAVRLRHRREEEFYSGGT